MSGQFNTVDFTTQDHGSVIVFLPNTDDAKDEMKNIGLEPWQMWSEGFALDRRAALELMDALIERGLSVE